ncbi:MAG: 3-deoxy-manno-octulosonate cytidylyltransferase [Pyrinomonadaceae bacterium]|nr:3-deoxy-manno-octulosonate cytidylyltransferase [Pyrinomonadaceae bacterium]
MEHHGNNPLQNVIAIVPARFESTRLPGKMLLPLAGKPLVLHTVDRAREAANVSRVIVATDDQRILDAVSEYGCEAVMTSPDHVSGSDRIAEVAAGLQEGSIIVNVQGDEPLLPTATIEKAVDAMLTGERCDIATTFETIETVQDVFDPNIVKVVMDAGGRALYFSRSPIPFLREAASRHGSLEAALRADKTLIGKFKKHTGLYVYRREFLLGFTKLQPTALEQSEMLEQLRALENGAVIRVVEAAGKSIGVDTQADLDRVREIMEATEGSFFSSVNK